MFDDSRINVTTDSQPVLGSPIEKPEYIAQFVSQNVTQWIGEIEKFSKIANSQPHAAFGEITHGLSNKWSYLSRTTPDISLVLLSMEFIPSYCQTNWPGCSQ